MKTLVLHYAKFFLLATGIILSMNAYGQVDIDRPVYNTDDSGPTKLCLSELETSDINMHPLSSRGPIVHIASVQTQTLNFISERPEKYFLHRLEASEPENISLKPVVIFGEPETVSTGLFQQFKEAMVLAYNAWKAIQLVRADVPLLLEGITRAAAKYPAS